MGKQDVAKEGGLEPKVNVFKIGIKLWRRDEETNVIQLSQSGIWRRDPQSPRAMGDFLEIFVIFAILTLFGSHFARF